MSYLKIGINAGYLPFYDSFILGGCSSIRGYLDGELGISRHILETSLEIRFNHKKVIEKFFIFFDYCNNLNSTFSTFYNKNSNQYFSVSGSSYGIGLYLGGSRIEYGINTTKLNKFLNFEFGERF